MSRTIPRTGVAQKVMLARQAAKQRDQEDATATRHTFVAPKVAAPKVAAAAAAAPQEPAPPREHIPREEASSSSGVLHTGKLTVNQRLQQLKAANPPPPPKGVCKTMIGIWAAFGYIKEQESVVDFLRNVVARNPATHTKEVSWAFNTVSNRSKTKDGVRPMDMHVMSVRLETASRVLENYEDVDMLLTNRYDLDRREAIMAEARESFLLDRDEAMTAAVTAKDKKYAEAMTFKVPTIKEIPKLKGLHGIVKCSCVAFAAVIEKVADNNDWLLKQGL
jgi:hypothetical protein